MDVPRWVVADNPKGSYMFQGRTAAERPTILTRMRVVKAPPAELSVPVLAASADPDAQLVADFEVSLSSDRALVGNIQDLPARLAVHGVEFVTLQTAGRASEPHLMGLQ